ncbi:hypothetical protein RvY_17399 [Ramazzottius varieornatus]|uniref:MAM domain-containing protein n=1 Tax=Ramazzottius varieornatus TaxID=947166 RepID=A0A1D1W1Z4_RAMVA|nr:hypothetical protein RvY_17399 [Ramazzottius varieornatus]
MIRSIAGLGGISVLLFGTFSLLHAIPLHRADGLGSTNTVTCNFTSNLCGWTGTVSGSQWAWTTESVLNIRPPEGYAGYAYVTSKHESWAELRSEPFTLTAPRILSFFILQQKFELSANTVELLLHPPRGSDVVIGSYRNAVSWKYHVLLLCPEAGTTTTQLVFRFKVGSERNLAAVAGVALSENTNPESIRPPPQPDGPVTDGGLSTTTDTLTSESSESLQHRGLLQTCVNTGRAVQLWRR